MPPDGFQEMRRAGEVVWVREGFSRLLDRMDAVREETSGDGAGEGETPAGRGQMRRIRLRPPEEGHALVRHYQRGGLILYLLGDLYLGAGRFFREVLVTEWARRQGIPTVQALLLRVVRAGFGFWRADLATRELAGAVDLDAYLRSRRAPSGRGTGRVDPEIVRAVARLLSAMHRAGLVHADLNLKNILIEEANGVPLARVIDLDRARVMDRMPGRFRAANLLRLYRSLEKQGHVGRPVTGREIVLFLREYCGGETEIKKRLLQYMRKPPLSLRYHRLIWRLFGGGPRQRDRAHA